MADESIIAAAEAMRIKRDELLDQPLARIWRDLAQAGVAAYRNAEAAQLLANCTHPNKRGSGSISTDGSSSWDWYCPTCGASDKGSTPATRQVDLVLTNIAQ